MGGAEAVERVWVARLQFKGATKEPDCRSEVALAGENVGEHDMVPCIVRVEAQCIDEVVLGRLELAQFVVDHGKVAVGGGEKRVGCEGFFVEVDGFSEFPVPCGGSSFFTKPRGFANLRWRGRGELNVGAGADNRHLDVAG